MSRILRTYTVQFSDVAVSAAQDLINLTSTANMAIQLLRIEGGQRGLTSWEAKPIKVIMNPATVTAGAGGTAPTPQKQASTQPAATFTSRANDTTAQTTSGTPVVMFTRTFEFLNGFLWVPTPEEEFIIGPSQGCQINLPTAPSGSTNMSFTVTVGELF